MAGLGGIRLGRWRSAALAAAFLLALALGGASVEAGGTPGAGATLVDLQGPEYALQGFRWDRTVVPVYYNWEGGQCAFLDNDFSGPATSIAPDVLLSTLQASINEINTNLRGGLMLQFAGPATRTELCSTTTTKPIVVGFGTISSTGQALSYGRGPRGSVSTYTVARVFFTNTNNFRCNDAPIYRDLEHTMTHELLHAIGIGHSNVASAIMTPTFTACRTPHTMQTDDIAAINALYPPTQPPVISPVVTSPAPAPPPAVVTPTQATGAFVTPVTFSSSGQALAVFSGGAIDQLEAAARTAGATGLWVQDSAGQFRLLVINGPAFLREQFRAAFPGGLTANVAVTLVR